MNVSINRNLLASVKCSRQRYFNDLEAKKKIALEEAKKLQENEEKVKQGEVFSDIDKAINLRRSGVTIAEQSIAEGNQKIAEELRKPRISQEVLQQGYAMIDMGLKCKQSLDAEISALEKMKARLMKK